MPSGYRFDKQPYLRWVLSDEDLITFDAFVSSFKIFEHLDAGAQRQAAERSGTTMDRIQADVAA